MDPTSWRNRGATALMLALVVSSTTVAVAVPPAVLPAAATLPPLADQVRYRAELGLPASQSFVTDLNARWAAGAVDDAHVEGAVFTAAEDAELDTREDAARDVQEAARAYFTGTRADAFGGVYIDHASGKAVVLVTRDAATHAAALRARTSYPDRVSTRTVRFARTDLARVADALVANATYFRSAGAAFTSVEADELNNRVVYGLAHDTAAARATVLATLNAADAAMVGFMHGGPVEPTGVDALNAPPLKGGQRITQALASDPTKAAGCTSAFIAYRSTRTDAAIYVRDYFMLTSGHCDRSAGVPWQQSYSYPIGVADLTAYHDLGTDAMRIPIRQADSSQFVAITATHDRHIFERQANYGDVLNERVCLSGATSGGEVCGTLLSRTFTGTQEGYTLKGLRVVTFVSKGGDSGGALLLNSMAKGIMEGNVTYTDGRTRAVYPHVHTAMQRLLLTDVVGVG